MSPASWRTATGYRNKYCLSSLVCPFPLSHANPSVSLQAKLPRGIHQVRPHLKNIDNVPLLVPLFTDCTPESESEHLHLHETSFSVFQKP